MRVVGASINDYPPNGIQRESTPAPKVEFSEGTFIDYRWFDQQGIEPVYGEPTFNVLFATILT